jgi:hypothetical protein
MRNAAELHIGVAGRVIVKEQHRARAAGEEFLERHNLTPVSQRVARQQAHFRQRVEDDPRWTQTLDNLENRLDRFAELHFRGVVERVVIVRPEPFRGLELKQLDSLEGPSVRERDGVKLSLGFR